ncbi:MAG: chemotaxis protein [Cellvibrionaceae bacterium]
MSLLDSVDQRTQLVGENRLELLLFRLGGRQQFALNVFKIQEVLKVPPLTEVPHRHPVVRGVTHMRGQTIPVVDLSQAIGRRPLPMDEHCNLIVTEYNRTIQGFLVGEVEHIVNMNWDQILPPPSGTGRHHYLTALTKVNDNIVEILDVERVLAEIVPYDTSVPDGVLDDEIQAEAVNYKILMVDDSSTARAQGRETMEEIGVEVITRNDGKSGWDTLLQWVDEGMDFDKLLMVVTDAEMPEMDGYTLTTHIRNHPVLQDLHVVLHTSLSGSFNEAMVEKVGCDNFLSKFNPEDLAVTIQDRIRAKMQGE